jgi:hypothetical protein
VGETSPAKAWPAHLEQTALAERIKYAPGGSATKEPKVYPAPAGFSSTLISGSAVPKKEPKEQNGAVESPINDSAQTAEGNTATNFSNPL